MVKIAHVRERHGPTGVPYDRPAARCDCRRVLRFLRFYYAQGVSVTTAILSAGWRDRLIDLDTPGSAPARGLCLEPHDCVVSKLVAGRWKDRDFAAALVRDGLVDADILFERINVLIDASQAERARLRQWVDGYGRDPARPISTS